MDKKIIYIQTPFMIHPIEKIQGKDERETNLLSITNHYKKSNYSEQYIDATLLSHGFSIKEIESVLN